MAVSPTAWEEFFKHAFGVLGTLAGFTLYASTAPVLIEIRRRRSTLQYTYWPFLLQWINCFCWVIYAFHRGILDAMMVSAGGGLMMTSGSLIVFWYYIVNRSKRWSFDLAVLVAIAVLITLAVFSFTVAPCDGDFATSWCWWKYLCITSNTCMYTGPVLAMYWTWQKRSLDLIPINLGIGGLISSLPWIGYALVGRDMAVLLPNAVGVSVALGMLLEYRLIKCLYLRSADLMLPPPKGPTSTQSELVLSPIKQALFMFFYMDMYAVIRPRVEIELSDLSTTQTQSEQQQQQAEEAEATESF